jgi:hypothetical protein
MTAVIQQLQNLPLLPHFKSFWIFLEITKTVLLGNKHELWEEKSLSLQLAVVPFPSWEVESVQGCVLCPAHNRKEGVHKEQELPSSISTSPRMSLSWAQLLWKQSLEEGVAWRARLGALGPVSSHGQKTFITSLCPQRCILILQCPLVYCL